MPEKEVLVSVIIPVYKVEPYLRQCVGSVLAQTYHNLEVILVDDGSPDSCGDICDEYASSDIRVKVIHQQNHGMAHARNSGLEIARGDYITFVDSDDFIDERCIEVLTGMIRSTQAEFACVDFIDYPDGGPINAPKPISARIHVTDNRDYLEALLYQTTGNSAVWGKMFSADLFRSARFREGIWYEDLELLSRILLREGKTAWSTARLYYYRSRVRSSMHSFEPRRLDVLEVTDEITASFAVHHPALLPAARSRRLSAYFNIYCLSAANGSADRNLESRCRKIIKEERGKFLFDPKSRLKNRIGILITYLGGFTLLRLLGRKIYK